MTTDTTLTPTTPPSPRPPRSRRGPLLAFLLLAALLGGAGWYLFPREPEPPEIALALGLPSSEQAKQP